MPAERRVFAKFGKGNVRQVIDDPETLKVLYDPVRFKLVAMLRDGRTAKELAEELGRPLTSLYYHLNLLADHGLVEVEEERIRGRTVERVFRRAADEFLADGEVGAVVDGLVDRDERLSSAVEHLRRIYKTDRSTSDRRAGRKLVMDVTFTADPETVDSLMTNLREVVQATVPESRGRARRVKGRKFRLLVTLGETDDDQRSTKGRHRDGN